MAWMPTSLVLVKPGSLPSRRPGRHGATNRFLSVRSVPSAGPCLQKPATHLLPASIYIIQHLLAVMQQCSYCFIPCLWLWQGPASAVPRRQPHPAVASSPGKQTVSDQKSTAACMNIILLAPAQQCRHGLPSWISSEKSSGSPA